MVPCKAAGLRNLTCNLAIGIIRHTTFRTVNIAVPTRQLARQSDFNSICSGSRPYFPNDPAWEGQVKADVGDLIGLSVSCFAYLVVRYHVDNHTINRSGWWIGEGYGSAPARGLTNPQVRNLRIAITKFKGTTVVTDTDDISVRDIAVIRDRTTYGTVGATCNAGVRICLWLIR